MKQSVAIVLLISIITIAFFGFNLIRTHGKAPGGRCIISLISTAPVPCPETNPIGFASYHLDAFNQLSLATPDAGVALLSLLFAVLLLQNITSLGRPATIAKRVTSIRDEFPHFYDNGDVLSWFSLHENSPSSS